jgi:hypothetical protein
MQKPKSITAREAWLLAILAEHPDMPVRDSEKLLEHAESSLTRQIAKELKSLQSSKHARQQAAKSKSEAVRAALGLIDWAQSNKTLPFAVPRLKSS